MPVPIHGKEYTMVDERVKMFHDRFKDQTKSILTEIIQFKDGVVVVKAVIKVGEDNKTMSNGSMGGFKIDGRTRDIHKQVCLKLAVESLGVVKSDNKDSDYLKTVAYRMDKFLEVLEGKADSLVEKVKEEFAGEEIPF